MLGSRASTIRDLLALAEPGWSPPCQPGGARVPEGSLFAAGCAQRRRPRRPALQKRKRTGAQSPTTGVHCCNPETSVGLMAAVAEPASARLVRVAEPARAGASGIVATLTEDLNRNGTSDDTASYGGGSRVNGSWLACELCRRRLDDMTIYIYMDKGFCQPECRYEYFLEEFYEQRRKLAAEARASKRAWRRHHDHDGKADLHAEAADRSSRRIFLAPDDERGDNDDDDSGSFP